LFEALLDGELAIAIRVRRGCTNGCENGTA